MPILISAVLLIAATVIGFLGQKSRMCFIGGFRDFFIIKDTGLLMGVLAFFVSLRLMVLLLRFFNVLVVVQPSFSSLLWSRFFLMSFFYAVILGMATTFSGACPFRHHVRVGQGDRDSLWFITGLYCGIVLYYLILSGLGNSVPTL